MFTEAASLQGWLVIAFLNSLTTLRRHWAPAQMDGDLQSDYLKKKKKELDCEK